MGNRPELHWTLNTSGPRDAAAQWVYRICLQAAARRLEQERKQSTEVEIQRGGGR